MNSVFDHTELDKTEKNLYPHKNSEEVERKNKPYNKKKKTRN